MTTGDRTYDANAVVVQSQVAELRAAAGGHVVLDPLAAPAGNVYATSSSAVDAARSAGPGTRVLVARDVVFDAVAHDASGVSFVGLGGGLPPLATLPDGCSITDSFADFSFENLRIAFAGASPCISVPVGATVTFGRYTSLDTTAATAGFLAVDGFLVLDANYAATIAGAAGHESIVFTANGGGQLRIGNFGTLAPSSVTGGRSGAVEITDTSKPGGGAAASIGLQPGLILPVLD